MKGLGLMIENKLIDTDIEVNSSCGIKRIQKIFSGKWKIMILWSLHEKNNEIW